MKRQPNAPVHSANPTNATNGPALRSSRACLSTARWQLTLLADDGDTAERYGVHTLPHTVVIDRDGIARLIVRGRRAGAIEDAVERLLAAAP